MKLGETLKLGKKNPILLLPCYSCWDWICELPVPKEHNLNAGGQLTLSVKILAHAPNKYQLAVSELFLKFFHP